MMEFLGKEFEIRSLPADRFIGDDIDRNRSQRAIHLSQQDYVKTILQRFDMANCHSVAVPADPCVKISPSMFPRTEEEKTMMAKIPFMEGIGSLMHLANLTRPDLAYAIGQVSRFSQNPGPKHWKGLKRILAYLRKTINHGILYGGGSNELHGYVDAEYAGDLENRRSTSGAVFILNSGPISWHSRRQTCVALSTTESEFIAAADGTKEAIWLRRLYSELGGPDVAMPLRCDNQGTIALIHNPMFHQLTKHTNVRFFFVRDAQQEGKIDINYIETESQLADIFTKALPVPRFEMLRQNLNIREFMN
jgi:hypothetical protein